MAESQDSHRGHLSMFIPYVSDWQVHKDQLNQYFVINGITQDEIKRGLLLNMCCESGYKIISTLCLPAKPETRTFEALITMLDKHFTPPKLIFRERQAFYEAKQQNSESVAEWAAQVKLLAGRCGFSDGELEVAWRDRFMCGLRKGPIKDALFQEAPEDLTFERAVEIARIKEENCMRDALSDLPDPDLDASIFRANIFWTRNLSRDMDMNNMFGSSRLSNDMDINDIFEPRRLTSDRGMNSFWRPRRLSDDTFRRLGRRFGLGPVHRPNRSRLHLGNPFPSSSSCSAAAMPPARFCDICAYYWVDSSARSVLPSTALHGGVDQDGSQIYVGRAFHDGDWIPAKVIPSKRVAYIPYGGKEHAKDRFQVLCEQRFDWVPSHGGVIPPGAVDGGRTSSGETLYIGRVHHKGSHTVGKVHPSHRVCYIPFDGKEVPYQQYEILVLRA